jgi:hypothetical protein
MKNKKDFYREKQNQRLLELREILTVVMWNCGPDFDLRNDYQQIQRKYKFHKDEVTPGLLRHAHAEMWRRIRAANQALLDRLYPPPAKTKPVKPLKIAPTIADLSQPRGKPLPPKQKPVKAKAGALKRAVVKPTTARKAVNGKTKSNKHSTTALKPKKGK